MTISSQIVYFYLVMIILALLFSLHDVAFGEESWNPF